MKSKLVMILPTTTGKMRKKSMVNTIWPDPKSGARVDNRPGAAFQKALGDLKRFGVMANEV